MLLDLYKSMGITTDLAMEAREIIRGKTGQEIPGVRMDREDYEHATVTIVSVEDQSAEKIMGKPVGKYITIEAPVLRNNDPEAHRQLSELLAQQLNNAIDIAKYDNILVVGLGNWNATPDALGPKVASKTVVTRHLFNYAPNELKQGMKTVSVLSPGVLGLTGIETAEIIKGVVEKITPQLIIAIDALAARSVTRIGSTIQIADTGISPGSGIGNKRMGINLESVGVPVVALGVPTVVHAAVIAQDTIESLMEQVSSHPALKDNALFSNDTIQGIIAQVLEPFSGNLMVTPKEIDDLIHRTARILAEGISMALHPDLHPDDYTYYLN